MAISQSKYIRISTDAGTTAIGSRDFSGLVFTGSAMLSSAPAATKTSYGTNYDVVGMSLRDVAQCFGNTSNEYKLASKYFGYLAKDGSSPSVLNFAMVKADETPATALARVKETTNNFGSFTFLSTTTKAFTIDNIEEAATANTGYDHAFLHCVGFEFDSTADASSKMAKFADAVGTFVYFGADAFGAAIPMAIVASIDWNSKDSTVSFMFKQVAGETAVITNDTDYESMKSVDANFYGQTMTNGRSFAFLQCGFNSNHEDTGVYVNEMWLKSAIATDFMQLCMTVNKIPANEYGCAMIRAAIFGNVQTALNNGTILQNKAIDDADRAEIYRYTGDESAADDVATLGYWLGISIEKPSGSSDYEAYYYLVYSKGDSVRFCNGHHKLI